MRPTLALITVAAVSVSACGDGVDLPVPANLAIVVGTNAQTAFAGARLPTPLAVSVTTKDGTTVPRARVEWSVTSGTGSVLSDDATLSDGTGRAQVELTLGPTAGAYAVRAALANDAAVAVSFTAQATDPPTLSAVVPSAFQGGDTIVLRGARLVPTLRVEIGTALAPVVTGSVGSDSMRTVVPRCLSAGAVSVRLVTDDWRSNSLSATYQASAGPVALAVGEYVSIDPALLGACPSFPDAGAVAVEYLIAPQSVTDVAGTSAAYRLGGDSFTMAMPVRERAARHPTLADRFHEFLRQREAAWSRLPRPPQTAPVAALAAAPKVGDRRQFRVCNIVTCSQAEDFSTVTAQATYVGRHAALYQDVNAPANGFTAADFDQLGRLFDDELYQVVTQAFGVDSDVDQNGLTVILLTPVVNALTQTSLCSTSFITGFFFALDVDPRFRNDDRSNQAEIFYAITPDPTGSVTCTHSLDRVRRLVPVVFVHELQHMISYNQHVLVRNGDSELTWLNEAMSHLGEELAAQHFLSQGDTTRFSRFAINDVFNAFIYLKDPEPEFVLFSQGTGTLEERGAGWLFLRWVVDQFGGTVTRRLAETSLTGAQNLEAATSEPLGRLLSQWFLANWVSDLPGFTARNRLRFTTWRFRTTYQSLNQQDPSTFDRPFPLEPPVFLGGTFQAMGTLRAGSGAYFRVQQQPGQRGFTLTFDDGAGGAINPAARPRLNIVRVQ